MEDLVRVLHNFLEQRNWIQFHSPKNLSMSIAIEAAELMELFQWLTIEESRQAVQMPEFRQALTGELADIFIYLLSLANISGIDLKQAFLEKMQLNEQRFPIEDSSMNTLTEKLKRTLQKE